MEITMLAENLKPNVTERFPWRLASILYSASFGLMFFFLRAYFWDDWAVKTVPAQLERDYWKDLGFPPPISFILIDVFRRNPVYLHLAIFVIFFACGWLLFQILQKVNFLTPSDRQLIAILFLVLPINSARVAMQMFSYSYSLFFFYAAWYLLVAKRGYVSKVISVSFFLLSFNTLSLITFTAIPAAHYLLLRRSDVRNSKFRSSIGSILLLVMAVAYWFFIKNVYPPSGPHLSYYSPTVSGTIRGIILILAATAFLGWTLLRMNKTGEFRLAKIALGIVLVSLGAFPYMTSGRLVDISEWMLNFVPRASEWDSRNQLLLGLGLSLLITGIIGDTDSEFKKKALAVFVGACVFLNFTFMQSYMLDAMKQQQVINVLSKSEVVKAGQIIMVNDLAVRYNARGRSVRTYEWDGILKKAFGDSLRKSFDYGYIDCSDPDIVPPDVLLTINSKNGRFKSLLTRNIGIYVVAQLINPCPTTR